MFMNKNASYSDEYWVHLAKEGNTNAYTELFNRYHTKIYQIISYYINDNANAFDLTQEVLLKVYRYLPYFNQNSLFSTWVFRITQNTLKNYYRSCDSRLDSECEFANNCTADRSDSPENLLISMEFYEQMQLAFLNLTEELRTSFGMHILEGHTYEHIAETMSCPIGTIRSRIFRARKLLLAELNQNK